MRIVFLQKTTDTQGGSKASLRNTLGALSGLPEVEIELCGEAPGELSVFAESLNISFTEAPFPRWRNLADRLRFNGTMKRFAHSFGPADWIVSNEMWWAPHAVVLAKHCGAKSATIVRDEIADLNKAQQYRFSELDNVITVSDDLKALLKADDALYAKTRTIYNIVDRPQPNTQASAAIETVCKDYTQVNRWVLSAGTICPRKDQILLVRALAEMVRRGDSGTGILFVGGHDGSDYESRVKHEVSALHLSDRVCFTGQLAGIGSALESAVAFALTSHSEGLPRVLIESALARVPSVSTQVSGVYEVYGEHSTRFVLSSREPSELADKLQSLLVKPDESVIESMATRMEACFSRTAHLESWKQFLGVD